MDEQNRNKDEQYYHDITLGSSSIPALNQASKKSALNNFFAGIGQLLKKGIVNLSFIARPFRFLSLEKITLGKKIFIFLALLLILSLISTFYLLYRLLLLQPAPVVQKAGAQDALNQLQLPAPLASQSINRNFSFPLADSNGKVVSTITYTLTDAKKQNEILVKGQPATSIKGKSFLIIDLKLTNSYDKPVQIQTKDYVRLSPDSTAARLSPDLNNDPVIVDAQSTKLTRVGFTIDSNAKPLLLYVGQLDGPKTRIDLHI